MSKPVTLLEDICAHVLSIGAEGINVERRDGREWVYARKGGTAIPIANFPSSSSDARELLENLHAAHKRPVRTVIHGQVRIIRVHVRDGLAEEPFDVKIDAAPKLDPSVAPKFTKKQGQYLAFIHYYSKVHRQAPAEADLERYFQVSPPAIHEMIKTLERNGLIEKVPGKARSISLLVAPEHLPPLE